MMKCLGRLAIAAICGGIAVPTEAQPTRAAVEADVQRLGDFDYAARTEASRAIRRVPADIAVPILREALQHHSDSYVQFRAAVLFYGFHPTDAADVFEDALTASNDRVRAAAYDYFAYSPEERLVPKLLGALDSETSEFVRPALIRALAAQSHLPVVRDRLVREIDRGQEYFRGAVIEALGDYAVTAAVDSLIEIAVVDGPLRDDAILALGKIGDQRALQALSRIQSNASERLQPVVSAAACLIGVDCDDQLTYLESVLRYVAHRDDEQSRLRSSAASVAALAQQGHRRALGVLFDVAAEASDAARAPIALAAGTVALRRPELVVDVLTDSTLTLVQPLELLRDAFDMLDEDLAEERFYMLMRRAYWAAPDDSQVRHAAGEAIEELEF